MTETRRVPVRTLTAEEAVRTFDEANLGYSREEAMREAARGQGADLSGSTEACPFHVDVAGLVRAVAAGDFDEALRVDMQAHPWAGILGRWCHHYCQVGHTLGEGIEPLNILNLERAAGDYGNRALSPFEPGASTGKGVAVIGAGSASSAAMYRLRQRGHSVAAYEQLSASGGMMLAGYPNFRLPLAVLRRENTLEEWGVETHYGVSVGRGLLDDLLERYDAVLLGTGKFKSIRLGVPGDDLDGVWDALDFLIRVKSNRVPEFGQKVVVFGAGYTAQDSSRTCARLGRQVTIYYRRSREEMPVNPTQIERFVSRQAAEGAPYVFQVMPTRVLGENGRVVGVEVVRTELGPYDESGRRTFVPVEGSEFVVECDTVIAATGQVVDLSFLPDSVALSDGQHVWVDPESWMTSLPHLFAAGEMTGVSNTTRAFASGFAAADGIDRFLREG